MVILPFRFQNREKLDEPCNLSAIMLAILNVKNASLAGMELYNLP